MNNEELNFQDDESCDHDNVCPCCEQRENTIENFLNRVDGLVIGSPEFIDEVESLIGFVELSAKRDTLASIAHGLIHEIKEIDGEE